MNVASARRRFIEENGRNLVTMDIDVSVIAEFCSADKEGVG